MRYCVNCRALGDYGDDPTIAANCGNHVYRDELEERVEREAASAKREQIALRCRRGGLPDACSLDITVKDGRFLIEYSVRPRIRQIDALAKEFKTKRINWINDGGGYHDTAGFHEQNFIEVIGWS